ncbi:MAG: energy transducer TonB [Polyangiaceae bacterium]|nr:energy transducer TonB [Polyangiaceae bacterium]
MTPRLSSAVVFGAFALLGCGSSAPRPAPATPSEARPVTVSLPDQATEPDAAELEQPPPSGESDTDAGALAEAAPGAEPAPGAHAHLAGEHTPRAPSAGPNLLEKRLVARVVQAYRARIRHCLVQALQISPALDTMVLPKLVVDDSGKVISATIEKSSGIPSLDACVIAAVKKMTFPASDRGNTTIRYPFLFKSE